MMCPVARRMGDESGIALPVAMIALVLITVLAGITADGAVRLSDTSNEDRGSKRALAAADAGLSVAAARLKALKPGPTECATNPPAPPASGSACPSYGEDLGNGARYEYTVSPAMGQPGAPSSCVEPIEVTGMATRCVTALGEASDERRRVQERAGLLRLFSLQGILGLTGVELTNSVTVNGDLGTNQAITLGQGTDVRNGGNLDFGASAPTPGWSAPSGQRPFTGSEIREPEDWALDPLDAEYAATLASGGNDNASVPLTYLSDNPQPRALNVGPNKTLVLAPGTYSFCSIRLSKSASVEITGPTRIFVDSWERPASPAPASGCAERTDGSGPMVDIANDAGFNNAGSPADLMLFVYGGSNKGYDVKFNSSAAINGAIYAPQSFVEFSADASLTGAIAAEGVKLNARTSFTYAGAVDDVTNGLYGRKAWRECPSAGCP